MASKIAFQCVKEPENVRPGSKVISTLFRVAGNMIKSTDGLTCLGVLLDSQLKSKLQTFPKNCK